MGLRTLRVGHLSGIPIGVQPLWLVIVALITVSLGAAYSKSATGCVCSRRVTAYCSTLGGEGEV